MRPIKGEFDPDVLSIVSELRAYRQAMNIPIKAVERRSKQVDACGFSDFAIRRWEAQRREPDLANLKIWAATLGYTIKVTLEVPE